MTIFASDFGGPYDLVIGCILWLLIPTCGPAWIILQCMSWASRERLSGRSLGLLLFCSALPGYIVATAYAEALLMGPVGKSLFFISAAGLVLLPLTLLREYFKFRRDRIPPRR
jgi:hypothetical protein